MFSQASVSHSVHRRGGVSQHAPGNGVDGERGCGQGRVWIGCGQRVDRGCGQECPPHKMATDAVGAPLLTIVAKIFIYRW